MHVANNHTHNTCCCASCRRPMHLFKVQSIYIYIYKETLQTHTHTYICVYNEIARESGRCIYTYIYIYINTTQLYIACCTRYHDAQLHIHITHVFKELLLSDLHVNCVYIHTCICLSMVLGQLVCVCSWYLKSTASYT
jgi:hypothetical protein